MPKTQLAHIEQHLDVLIAKCRQLEQENQALRTQADQWQQERSRLIEKNEMACNRIEAMITRLKQLELPSP